MDRSRSSRRRPLLAVAAAAFLASCTTRGNAVAAGGGESVRAVAVERVTRQDLGRSLELAAEFRPNQEVDLHAKIAGYVKVMHVDVGDHVIKGQLIAELEAPEMTQQLAQAEATLRRSQADVAKARSELQRSDAQHSIRQLSFDRLSAVIKARPNLVAQQELDDASSRLQEADAQLASSQAAVTVSEAQVEIAAAAKKQFEAMLTYLRITAPFAGTITKRFADPGAMIQAGTASNIQAMPVVQLSQVNLLRLVLPVPESVVPRIRTNAPVEVRVESLKRVFQGRISRFTGKLDGSTRTMETEVDLSNPDSAIKPGMFGYATLELEQRQDVLTIPVQALSGRSVPVTVLVIGPDKRLQERQVNLGMETPARIEVVSGLRANDMVVVGARANLHPGLLVEPKVQDSTAPGGGH